MILICTKRKILPRGLEDFIGRKIDITTIFKDPYGLCEFLKKHNNDCVIFFDEKASRDINYTIEEIFVVNTQAKIVILSNEPNFINGKELLEKGIVGYGNIHMKSVHYRDILTAVKDEKIWLYPEFMQHIIRTVASKRQKSIQRDDLLMLLTPREKEISKLIVQGHNNQEISEIAKISLRTVKAHVGSIYEKLQVSDRVALVLLLSAT